MEKRFLSPREAALAIMENGKRVTTQPVSQTIVLSLLAGFYIAFGAQLATVITQDSAAYIGEGLSRLLAGSVFSMGLMLVVICGAELFTGNSLLTKSAMQGQIPWRKIWENWLIVIFGNLIGSLFFAWLMLNSDLWKSGNVADYAISIAASKCELSFSVALVRGIFCNWLVCLAVFMATAARDIPGKILACYVPIMTFVASGFEHSVANMYFIPTGLLLADELKREVPGLTWGNFLAGNLLPVTVGNILGGVVFVALTYWFIYLRGSAQK
ncbi:formate/nitrite transporter family protein [Desulfuromonas sp. AOP6]|uniref:formate/nitrite transporter family protein n=1 Tax=Desulfuromonas sp. AOP6 TaxID=1566351 RepID=UPI00127FE64F|nr:formate/nitrite transporter family protein [Desulfuromonas sp. AOP6]BCA79629.1 bidirectional formate transporter [Desulfuromonas sp. AOP6]